MTVRWLSAVLDTPRNGDGDASVAFWQRVTRWDLSPRRGQVDDLTTLPPGEGDAVLRVQEVDDDVAGLHIHLQVDDLATAAAAAVGLGGAVVLHLRELVVARSPGGLCFCLTPHGGESRRPPPVRAAHGGRSLVDQVCLDMPASSFADEVAFWSALTGWERRRGRLASFEYLVRPPALPLRLLLQRQETDEAGRTGAHLDLACEDRDADERVHLGLGATLIRRTTWWTTLADPAGRHYCLTRRHPLTGELEPERDGRAR